MFYSIFHTYFLESDLNIEQMRLQKEEVKNVKWMSTKEIDILIHNKTFLESHGILFNVLKDNKIIER